MFNRKVGLGLFLDYGVNNGDISNFHQISLQITILIPYNYYEICTLSTSLKKSQAYKPWTANSNQTRKTKMLTIRYMDDKYKLKKYEHILL